MLIARNFIEHERPEIEIQLTKNPPRVLDTPQIRLEGEIPNHGFLPRVPLLDSEKRPFETICPQFCDEGFRFFSDSGFRALAYALAVG
jgi:hypothetical protein